MLISVYFKNIHLNDIPKVRDVNFVGIQNQQ